MITRVLRRTRDFNPPLTCESRARARTHHTLCMCCLCETVRLCVRAHVFFCVSSLLKKTTVPYKMGHAPHSGRG